MKIGRKYHELIGQSKFQTVYLMQAPQQPCCRPGRRKQQKWIQTQKQSIIQERVQKWSQSFLLEPSGRTYTSIASQWSNSQNMCYQYGDQMQNYFEEEYEMFYKQNLQNTVDQMPKDKIMGNCANIAKMCFPVRCDDNEQMENR